MLEETTVFKNKKPNIQVKTAVEAMYNLLIMYHLMYNSVYNLFSRHNYRHCLAKCFVVLFDSGSIFGLKYFLLSIYIYISSCRSSYKKNFFCV